MDAKKTEETGAEKIVRVLQTHFDERVAMFGAGLKSVDWKSREAQYNRFRELLKIVDSGESFSILDYGCGDGELFELFQSSIFPLREYNGFDVSPLMIEAARERFSDDKNCRFSTNLADFAASDYAVASGIFNMKFETADEDWKEYMRQTLDDLNRLSVKGFAFNALTSYSDPEFRRADLFYADPLYWFDYCKRKFSRFVSLLHDYPEYDFTIIVRKNR